MSFAGFTANEINAVLGKFPKLELVETNLWRGELDIYAEYDAHKVRDTFSVEIEILEAYPHQIPLLRVLGNRVREIGSKYSLTDLRDLHYNPAGTACLCVKQVELKKFPAGSSLTLFIEELVTPYLYGLSYYDTHGRWPWQEYSHGGLGLLEYLVDDPVEQSKDSLRQLAPHFVNDDNWKRYRKQIRLPNPRRTCTCKSGKPFSTCHPRAWKGVLLLHADLKRLKLNAYKLFTRS
ncbi:MAG: hypothetical protein WCT28_01945 [Patescibacteria group bacterium]|jgi:hypothetical protein